MKNYKTFYENTIIDNIDFEGYENVPQGMELYDKIQRTYETFISEYGYNIKNLGVKRAFAEWLRGLPTVLTVPFYYDEILQNALLAGIEVKDEELFCEQYWDKLAVAFFTLKDNL